MARTKGSYNVNTGRFIRPNQFKGQAPVLAVWNTMNVATNLAQIGGDDLAERYLAVNLLEQDYDVAMEMAQLIQKMRHPMYGLRAGDSPYHEDMGVKAAQAGWSKRLDD